MALHSNFDGVRPAAVRLAAAGFLGSTGPRYCEGPWLPLDETGAFERQHHLVNRRRADAEIFLRVGFGGRPAVQPGIEVGKSEILPLLGREGLCRRTHASHPIQLFVRASSEEDIMNVAIRSNSAKSSAPKSERCSAAASMRPASSSGRRFCWPAMAEPATRRAQGASAWAARPCTGPSDASWEAIWSER